MIVPQVHFEVICYIIFEGDERAEAIDAIGRSLPSRWWGVDPFVVPGDVEIGAASICLNATDDAPLALARPCVRRIDADALSTDVNPAWDGHHVSPFTM
jgi:hypothetical protein